MVRVPWSHSHDRVFKAPYRFVLHRIWCAAGRYCPVGEIACASCGNLMPNPIDDELESGLCMTCLWGPLPRTG